MSSVLRRSGFRSAVERPMVGDTKTSMVRVDHLGWLVCDGRALLKSEYRSLYAVLGDDFNPPMVDPSYFYLPDAQGRVVGLIGAAVDVSDRVWLDGEISGDYVHTLTVAELPAHNHDISGGYLNASGDVISTDEGNTSEDGFHSHTSNATGGNPGPGLFFGNGLNTPTGSDPNPDEMNIGTSAALTINPAGAHRHQIASNGGSLPHNNIQPTIFMGNLFVYCGQPGKNITQADGISLPAAGVRSYYPPSEPANKLY